MKVTTKGQVTIPQHIRRYMGVSAYSNVDFEIRNNIVILVKTPEDKTSDEHSRRFAALRGSKRDGLATDEWMNITRGE